MNSTMTIVLMLAALLIILALSVYAGRLLWLVKKQRIEQEEKKVAQQKALASHDTKILQSVLIIVKAMQEEQCDYSEGCWRLSVLLDSLKLSTQMENEFPAIFNLYKQIKHLSILDERKQMAKRDRMKQDLERMKVEAQCLEGVSTTLPLLRQYTTERLAVLANDM
ncbi:hypothetical protein theurythT_02440 [Thalassotalea eurytherma]|uniref:DUF2489 domain-containing protein n=2 Tax=Thalassotalea eurytherma TaxID=1144278 RepID=A0ABQ6H1U9_9GAMM|nr:hypothetical protein theurythT_02440 [Thalassotalea eurytherma]